MNAAVIPLADIRTDGGTQSRVAVDESVVAEYAENVDALPALTVFYDGTSYWLADGFHRLGAHVKVGRTSVIADVKQGDKRAAILYSVGANSSHGLRRSNSDKRRAVELLLRDEEWSKRSDRWIAEKCGVGHPFVATMRSAQLESDSSSRVRTGQDGKTRKLPERAKPESRLTVVSGDDAARIIEQVEAVATPAQVEQRREDARRFLDGAKAKPVETERAAVEPVRTEPKSEAAAVAADETPDLGDAGESEVGCTEDDGSIDPAVDAAFARAAEALRVLVRDRIMPDDYGEFHSSVASGRIRRLGEEVLRQWPEDVPLNELFDAFNFLAWCCEQLLRKRLNGGK